ncbi:hypothetical protein JCGZ_25493 [Jatropha curcas]|uniref:Uncharacterized protein n=1 Tax=Jatropha curcas TaxID=180498 RepID=A0A067JYZ5_JATCU|nr:hypothetical protein JCGZ_25493 [Jatropha curcas]
MTQSHTKDIKHHDAIHLPNTAKMAFYINKATPMAHFLHSSCSKNANPSKRTLALSRQDTAIQQPSGKVYTPLHVAHATSSGAQTFISEV